jgi:hypothetical protein
MQNTEKRPRWESAWPLTTNQWNGDYFISFVVSFDPFRP